MKIETSFHSLDEKPKKKLRDMTSDDWAEITKKTRRDVNKQGEAIKSVIELIKKLTPKIDQSKYIFQIGKTLDKTFGRIKDGKEIIHFTGKSIFMNRGVNPEILDIDVDEKQTIMKKKSKKASWKDFLKQIQITERTACNYRSFYNKIKDDVLKEKKQKKNYFDECPKAYYKFIKEVRTMHHRTKGERYFQLLCKILNLSSAELKQLSDEQLKIRLHKFRLKDDDPLLK